jgi:WD40 repeat protein
MKLPAIGFKSWPYFLANTVVLLAFCNGQSQPPPVPAPERTAVAMAGNAGMVWCLAFSPDGTRLAGGVQDGTVRLWDSAAGKEISILEVEAAWDRGICFSPDGILLAGAAASPRPNERPGRIALFDAQSGKVVRTLKGSAAGGVAFSPDGKLLIGTADGRPGMLKLWNTSTGEVVRKLESSGLDALAGVPVAFGADGKYIAGAGQDGRVKIWDTATGKVIHSLKESDARSTEGCPVAFGGDGKRLAAGSRGAIIVWDVETGKKLLATDAAHANGVVGVFFSPDGKQLVSAGNRPHAVVAGENVAPVDDGEVKVWDAENGKELSAFPTFVGGVRAAALSKDGKQIAVSPYAAHLAVRVWPLKLE